MKIVIEGNINSGKTTFIDYIRESLDENLLNIYDSGSIYFHPDPKFNLINLAEKNPKEWSFLKQEYFMKYLSYFQNDALDDNKINIFSRSLFSAHHVFNKSLSNILPKDQYNTLEKLYESLLVKEKPIDILFFFTSDHKVLTSRTTNNICKTNIEKYQEYYDTLLDKILPYTESCVVLDSSSPLDELKKIYDMKIEEIVTNAKSRVISRCNSFEEKLLLNE